MKKSDVEALLLSKGFLLSDSSNFGDSYSLALTGSKWSITAYAGKEGSVFQNTVNHDVYKEVSVSLDSKGTDYEFHSLAALQNHLDEVTQSLTEVSQNEDLLKCPKCGTRYVHCKTPSAGQSFKPFLSCDGMTPQKGGKNRGKAYCDGVSKKLPPQVIYK
jgi:hypothetical protein